MITFDKEQIFIVTGASSGLGEGVALLLNELGASVVGIARNEARLGAVKAKCKYPENMFLEIKDLSEDIEGLPNYIKELKNKYGKFSGMAYCAGISSLTPLQSLEYANMQKMFDINYFAPVFMLKGLTDKRNNIGAGTSVVLVSSISALCSDKGHTEYAGAKAALCASARSIAREVASNQLRINCVLPSNIRTPMLSTADDGYEESQKHLYPMGFGEPCDVANMIAFLLSDKAKWLTAQNYVIDCGGVR